MFISRVINYYNCIKQSIEALLGLVEDAESPFNHGPFYQACFPVPIDPEQTLNVNSIVCNLPLGVNIISITLLTYTDGDGFNNENIELLNHTLHPDTVNLSVHVNLSGYAISDQFYICIQYIQPVITSNELTYNGSPLLYNGQPLIFTNLWA